jgi:hypothetical protein
MADHTNLPPKLVAYWVAGEGAAKIGWNTPGDFERCKTAIQAAVVKDGKALSDRVLSGLCSNLHVLATGGRPGRGSAEGQ